MILAEGETVTVSRGEDHLRTAPRVMVGIAAQEIVDGFEITRTLNKWAPVVARSRVRRNAESVAFLNDEGRLAAEYSKACTQVWQKVEAILAAEKKDPLRYLSVRKNAEKAWEVFDKALTLASRTGRKVPKCDGKSGLYSDYGDDSVPTQEDAELMCAGCPLLKQCEAFARLERPTHGVWAGQVYGSLGGEK